MKVRILHSYVKDLSDQNQVLVQTVEDLEKEADEKVSYLDAKLLRAKQTLNNYKTIISEKEKVATGLAKTKESLQHEISVLSSKWECTEKAAECLRSENLDMKIDIATLIGAMQQGRIMQKLDQVLPMTFLTLDIKACCDPFAKHRGVRHTKGHTLTKKQIGDHQKLNFVYSQVMLPLYEVAIPLSS
ncbi:UNVERIFIED_CONTAM: hypothetical protein FKN15_012708 [Acipenser sinensis]